MIPDYLSSINILNEKVKDCTLFPMLYEEMKDLAPGLYFGGMEVPPYLHSGCGDDDSIESIVNSIRAIGGGANCCGYIDAGGLHYHLASDDEIYVDLSKEFVFISEPQEVSGSGVTSWQVLRFLQEPVRAALFIGIEGALMIEKTPETYALCEELDRIWATEDMQTSIQNMIEKETLWERGLPRLMKLHEEETFGESSEMWDFWSTFGCLLMERNVRLAVRAIP